MLNSTDLRDLRDIKQRISQRRRALESVLGLLAEVESSLEEQEKALERYELAEKALKHSEAAEALIRLLVDPVGDNLGRKPNVQVFEEIVLDNGRPMHASDIAREAERRGVEFQGTNPKSRQVRNSLVGSKRFLNAGGNRWWVTSHRPPTASDNGEEQVSVLDKDVDPVFADGLYEFSQDP